MKRVTGLQWEQLSNEAQREMESHPYWNAARKITQYPWEAYAVTRLVDQAQAEAVAECGHHPECMIFRCADHLYCDGPCGYFENDAVHERHTFIAGDCSPNCGIKKYGKAVSDG